MTRRALRFAVTVSLLLGCRFAVAADAVDEQPLLFTYGAFGTFDIVHSDERRADFSRSVVVQRGAGASDDWAVDVDSLLGAQVGVTLGSRWSAVLQIVAEHNYDNSYRPHVEWANVKYAITPQLSIRLGRTALPVFEHTEVRKVTFALPWVRAPQEVYELVPVTSNDGLDVIWNASRGRLDNTLQVAIGRSSSKYRVAGGVTQKAKTRDQFTVADTIGIGHLSLRANYGQSDLTIPAVQPLFDAFRQFGASGAAIADRYEAIGALARFYGASATFDPGHWFLRGEWGALRSGTHVGDRQGWYVSSGRRFGQFTPYLTYGEMQLDRALTDPGLDVNTLPASAAPLAFRLNAALNYLLNTPPRQATATLGVRWDVRRNASIKAQYDFIDLAPGSSGTFVNLQPGFPRGGDVSLFSLSVDFVL